MSLLLSGSEALSWRDLGCRAGTVGIGIVMEDAQTSGFGVFFQYKSNAAVERQSEAEQK